MEFLIIFFHLIESHLNLRLTHKAKFLLFIDLRRLDGFVLDFEPLSFFAGSFCRFLILRVKDEKWLFVLPVSF